MLPTPAVARRAARLWSPSTGATRWCSGRRPRSACSRPGLRAAGRAARRHAHPRPRGGLGGAPGRPPAARGIGGHADVVTYLGEYTRRRLAAVIPPAASWYGWRPAWTPPCSGRTPAARRARELGLADRPVVVCVSRLVPRKGQDMLIRAWPRCCGRCPTRCCCSSAAGRTADAGTLAASRRWRVGRVHRSRCPWADLPGTTPRATCSPCRAAPAWAASTWRGSASSTWRRPRPGCRSWPAPPAAPRTRCCDGETGLSSTAVRAAVAAALIDAAGDPDAAREMGERGRDWVDARVALGPRRLPVRSVARRCADLLGHAPRRVLR